MAKPRPHSAVPLDCDNRAVIDRAYSRRWAPAFRCATTTLAMMAFASTTFAQEGPQFTKVPNEMGTHTRFIILFVGAFLAWCISYALEIQKESHDRSKGRQDLLQLKAQLLEQAAEIETQREGHGLSEQEYAKKRKNVRRQLSRVLEQLGGDRNRAAGR